MDDFAIVRPIDHRSVLQQYILLHDGAVRIQRCVRRHQHSTWRPKLHRAFRAWQQTSAIQRSRSFRTAFTRLARYRAAAPDRHRCHRETVVAQQALLRDALRRLRTEPRWAACVRACLPPSA